MTCCEKCWEDAFDLSLTKGLNQMEAYKLLIEERKDAPCSPQEQAGQFWDTETKKRRVKEAIPD